MTTPESPILRMEGVSKVFGDQEDSVHALTRINFYASRGELCLLMGPSGSGKTTLLTIAGALQKPTSGSVAIGDIDVTKMDEGDLPPIRRQRVGFIFQHFNLIESLSAAENVALVMIEGRWRDKKRRAVDLLGDFGLAHRARSRPKTLSGGERQRVAIARSLANDPDLILADEPVSSLDSERVEEVLSHLKRTAFQLGKAVVIISHDHRIREIASRTLWLEDGQFQPMPGFDHGLRTGPSATPR